jgi:hypothetical protein
VIRLGVLLALALLPAPALACRLALAMALDVSGSVDQTEYRLQLEGVADALVDPDVQAAIFAMPDAPVAVAVFEWSSSQYQRVISNWAVLHTHEDLVRLAHHLRTWPREPAPEATGIGAALEFGSGLLARNPGCWQETLDISGDGKNNDWPLPRDLRRHGKTAGMRVNALVISRDHGGQGQQAPVGTGELSAYFHAEVIQGPDAFVEVALGFQDYARAMKRKLLREMATRPLGHLPSPTSTRERLARRAVDQ